MTNLIKKIKMKRRYKLSRKFKLLITITLILCIGTLSILKKADAELGEFYTSKVNSDYDKVTDSEYLILVNRENKIDSTSDPNDLVIPNIEFLSSGNVNRSLKKEAAKSLEAMFQKAQSNGIYLRGVSGYRSYEYQERLYEKNLKQSGKVEADKYVAQAGNSEHQTGLVMDVLSTEYTRLDGGFENTNSYRWLIENISDYGFIIRYPKGKENITGYEYEPWHIRYVGKEAAKEINERGLTLEEYLNKVNI